MIPSNCNSATAANAATSSLHDQYQAQNQMDHKSAVAAGQNSMALTVVGNRVSLPPCRADFSLVFGIDSFMNRMVLQMGVTSQMDLQDLRISASKVFKPLMPAFRVIEKLMQKSLNDDPELSIVMQNQVQASIHKLTADMQRTFALAGVKSYSELMEKRRTIDGLKQLAWQKFFADPKNVALKVQCDEALVLSGMGEVLNKDKTTIQQYWTLVTKDPEGYATHLLCEERISSIFLETLMKTLMDTIQNSNSINRHGDIPLEGLEKSLYSALHEKEGQLRKESSSKSDNARILTEYLILKGRLLGPTIIKMVLKQFLEDKVQEKEAYVQHMLTNFVIPTTETDLKNYRDKLENPSQLARIKAWEGSRCEPEYIAKQVAYHMKNMEEDKIRYSERIAELESPDYNITRVYHFIGTHPDAIRKLIPKDTPHDKLIHQMFGGFSNGVPDQNSLNMSPSRDLEIDLTKLQDPVGHFHNKMKAEVTAQLKLVQASASTAKIEVISS